MKLRIGYSFWGFLADEKFDLQGKPVSAPDGNATYSWSIIWEAMQRGHEVHRMQEDRDRLFVLEEGPKAFQAFSQKKRFKAYRGLIDSSQTLPKLDVLLLEWRWPIIGKNCTNISWESYNGPGLAYDSEGQKQGWVDEDWKRQSHLLTHYLGTDTRIIIWDLDHKLRAEDETHWKPDAIFETSINPRKLTMKRIRVEPPICVEDLRQFETEPADPDKMLAYIGSRYERDEVIDRYIGPLAKKHSGKIHFYGKWEPKDELVKRWPGVVFHDRCTVKDFHNIYRDAGCVPLLAKPSYLETGFITPRPWEALMFGSFPVGLIEGFGHGNYAAELMDPGDDTIEVVEELAGLSLRGRSAVRKEMIDFLEFMDARHFVDKIEGA